MKKQILILALLLIATQQVTVTKTDNCDACTQFKSSADCKAYGCTWTDKTATTAGSCATTVDPYVQFCSTVSTPATNCAKQNGCAYDSGKCVPFSGCSAYAKTSTTDCQAISYLCIFDGTSQCTDVKECSAYSKDVCESTPSLYSPYKCKLDGETCRPYKCSEADVTLTTNKACDSWLSGCKTTGYGCIDVVPACSSYTGTAATCPLMKGTDGICDFDATNNVCKARDCVNAPATTATDADCGTYKTGCVTTGKGCITARAGCSSYTGNSTTCVGYIGSDGDCAGDATGTQCRAKKCEDKTATTNTDCGTWKTGCVTNGKSCVASLGLCSSYTGTTTTCAGYIGSDGNCKGTSATTAGACAPKDCTTDAKGTETSNTQCQTIQSSCLTTGKGCAKTLGLCSSYSFTDDGTSCLSLVGSDGKCKAGSGGKCAQKLCTDAPITTTTNQACDTFQPGCVTTGAGCVTQQTCSDVSKQATCEGSTTNKCGWNAICNANTACSDFKTKSLCNGYKIGGKPCTWDTTQATPCRAAVCTDFQGTSDSICDSLLTGCVSNGTDCLDGTDCSKFKGIQATCQGYKAKCTNPSTVSDATTPCVAKTCDDTLTYDNDTDCGIYLSTCVTKGTGCISKSSPCSAYSGTPDQCDKFTGSSGANRCWNTSGTGACVNKACTQATGMTGNIGCDTFLTGCLYDGNGSCVDKSAACSAYTGDATTCPNFTGSGGHVCWDDPASTKCKNKECSDNTTATTTGDCGTFLDGCVTKGTGCIADTAVCSSYTGTTAQCNTFTGNKIQCTRLEACAAKTCSTKADAADNAACLTYHSTCRLQQGTTTCMLAPAACTGFNNFATGATDAQKLAYCNSVKNSAGDFCGYDSTANTACAARVCKLWDATLTGVTCADYAGTASCRLDGDSKCYAPNTCDNYVIPTGKSDAAKLTYCNSVTDNTKSLNKCTYDSSASSTNCSVINNCEEILSPTSAADCNLKLKGVTCQFYSGKCYTTKKSCALYSLTGITANQQAYCSAFKQDDTEAAVQCAYTATTTSNCVNACSVISSPSAQADCDTAHGCKFYSSACYARVPCASYAFPGSASTAALKQLFCQNMYDGNDNNFCSYDSTANSNAGGCAAPKATCAAYTGLTGMVTATTATNMNFCNSVRDQTGMICTYVDNATACSDPADDATKCSLLAASMTTEADCDLRTLPICKAASNACVTVTACSDHDVTGITNQLGACQSKTDASGNYCTYTTGNTCDAGKTACTGWSSLPASGQAGYCQTRIDKTGAKCAYTAGTNNCVAATALTCGDIASPKSQADCDVVVIGCTYNYAQQVCYAEPANCNTLAAQGATVSDKAAYCGSFSNASSVQCTYLTGTNCINIGACSTYDVTALTAKPDRVTACQAADSTDTESCTFFGAANACIKVTACASYTAGDATTCGSLDTTDTKCVAASGSTTACATYATCEDIVSPGSITDCNLYVTGCIYIPSKCITPKSDCTYAYSGSAAKSYCSGLKNTNGDYCTAALDSDTVCKNRACNDADAALFVTHSECQTYSSKCKSNGTSCIDATTTCASVSGNPSYCAWALDTDNKSTCVAATPSATPAACRNFDCTQNVYATSDGDCISFDSTCVTSGNGCIAKTEPCTSYNGTKVTCANFTGNGKKCWGDSTTKAACRDRVCTDKTTAANQGECDSFLTGCVYNGAGCVDPSASCTSYKGTQTECSSFMGNTKSQYCWGASTTVSGSCTVRKCSDKTATTDADCGSFMPPISPSTTPNCITDGTTCTDYGKQCSFFKGNDETCAKFTATDGICKASVYSTSPVACAPRVCYEAPNSFTTDAQCSTYQKGCKTTGKGCIASPVCTDLQTQSACSANTSCLWATQCRSLPTTCATFNSQTICINTPLQNGKSCAWYNGVCRDYTCADYDASIIAHADCQKKDLTCTTSGAGCVTLGICSSYKSRTVCEAAQTTEASIRCTWNATTNSCRQRQCADGVFTTDDDCNKFLAGCKSTGASCVGPSFGCSVFTGYPKQCLQNSSGQPCLRVNDICYDFNDCTDAAFNNLNTCQKFSTLCVPNSTSCRAMTFCEKYENQISCTLGITSAGTQAACGWMPTGKCATYTNCGDAAGATLQDCVNWNSKCVSDGTKCVDKGTCASYGNEIACGNAGTDGLCKWTGSACRLRECGDNIAVTDTDCAAYTVAAGVCTTDGTKCVLRAACSSYTEQGCFYGSDGIPCVFDYPAGTTTGTKACRPKECIDIKGTSNDQCIGQIPNKKCVSDGTICQKQDVCSAYKNKTSCKAGGSDGTCAFTPAPTTTNANAGSCALFKSCDVANKDQDACQTKQKQCKWSSTTSGTTTTTTCAAMDCASAASGTNCVAVPNFDSSSFTICVLNNGACTAGDPSTITQDNCYKSTVYSYTWNESTNKCVSCKGITTPSNNSTGGNTTNGTNTTTDSGYILGVTIPLAILGLFA